MGQMLKTSLRLIALLALLSSAFLFLTWWIGRQVEILSPFQHQRYLSGPPTAFTASHRPAVISAASLPPAKLPDNPPAEAVGAVLDRLLPKLPPPITVEELHVTPDQTLNALLGLAAQNVNPIPTLIPSNSSTSLPGQAASKLVWVDTPAKVYYCDGDRDFGHAKRGAYMSEEAAKAVARPAKESLHCR